MIKELKAKIQDKLYQDCIEEYHEILKYQKDPYLMWVQNVEKDAKEAKKENYPAISWVQMEKCDELFSMRQVNHEYVIFTSSDGKIAVSAFDEVENFFETHPDTDILYADEDVWMILEDEQEAVQKTENADIVQPKEDESRHRIMPWLKPVWSPDTLFSFQYFGHFFAIRKKAFEDISWLGEEDYRKNIYDFLLKATERTKKAAHLDRILFHKYEIGHTREEIEKRVYEQRDLWGQGADYDEIKKQALRRRNLQAEFVTDKASGISYPLYQTKKEDLISIVIPSKDNLEVLKQCLLSIYEKTAYKNYEIIVVDNGSSAQTRMSIERFKKEHALTYLYQPMTFNFSKMCNLGVRHAKGAYLLFLNDDMEVIDELWLHKMVGQASLAHVGAVGAKLYYPESKLIQHAGIYNTCAGPGHKLRRHEDDTFYYYGRNKLIYDMIGVTAACLMMRKDRFEQLGGLYEGLPVAYNDVDLCFRIYEKGWYCVQRNDVCLYHHESLSRGDDMMDAEKLERLMKELEHLYHRHPQLYHTDPFLGTLVNSGEDSIGCRWMESYEFPDAFLSSEIKQGRPLPNKNKMNRSIYSYVDECQKEYVQVSVQQTRPYYLLRGWAYIHEIDNAKYRFTLILENEAGATWEIPVQRRYRKDVAEILSHEMHIELAGFCCWFYENTIPKGKYRLWIKASDRCSRQRLYCDTEHILEVEE